MSNQRVYSSPYLRVQIPTDLSIWEFLLKHNIDDTPLDKVVVQEHARPDKKITWGSARRVASLGAAGLRQRLGLKSHDTIFVIGFNSIDYIHAAHAGWWAGITVVFTNPLASAHELVHYMTISEPSAIFCDEETTVKVREAIGIWKQDGTSQPAVVGLGDNKSTPLSFPSDFLCSAAGDVQAPFSLASDDNRKRCAAICFSSGTSGNPKAVMISHHNFIGNLVQARVTDPEAINGYQRQVFTAPVGHMYGVAVVVLTPFFTGTSVLLMRRYDFREYITAASTFKATSLRLLPTIANAMVKDPFVSTLDLTSVSFIGCSGAVLGPAVISKLQEMVKGCAIVQGYGMTEGACSMLKKAASGRKAGSVGRLVANSQLRIVDDDLNDVKEGEEGEFLIRGPSVFMGYKNNPEATAEAFPFNDGWLRTGDVGRIDAEGYVYLTDRKKDMIKYNGNQLPPSELEDVLLSHPLVTEAGVCGIWDEDQQTELAVGYVNFQPEVRPAERPKVLAEVTAHLNRRVAAYKKLRGGLFFLENFPRNATGKLLRRSLPARLAQDAQRVKKSSKL